MARAYSAQSFKEEKRALIEEARALAPHLNWDDPTRMTGQATACLEVFQKEFRRASAEARGDRDVVLSAVSVSGDLLQHCSPSLCDDFAVVDAATNNQPRAIRFASPRLKGERCFLLKAAERDLYALKFVSEVPLGDKETMLAAVNLDPWSLKYASEAVQADREVVMAALSKQSEDAAGNNVLRHAASQLKRDKDIVLFAIRSAATCNAAFDGFLQADLGLQESTTWETFFSAAESVLALPGEKAPVASVFLSPQVDGRGGTTGSAAPCLSCEVNLLSGKQFCFDIQSEVASGDGKSMRSTVVNDLAKMLLESTLADHKTVFVVIQIAEGVDLPMSPWDWNRPLTELLRQDDGQEAKSDENDHMEEDGDEVE